MFSNVPIDTDQLDQNTINKSILRISMMSELDAINLYEQFAEMTDDEDLQTVLLDIAKEEKTHIGEFETMLLHIDEEQREEIESAQREVEELTGIEEEDSE